MIGVWLSQAGLLYPLSSDCFGVLEESSYFPQHLFLMFIILLDIKTFGVCNSSLVLGMRD